jgi:hypothetical protein
MEENQKTLNEVAWIVADFMNEIQEYGGNNPYEDAVIRLILKYDLSPEQESMVRIALSHLELLACNMEDEEALKCFVGLECNVLVCVVKGEYEDLNRRVLKDKTFGS